MTQSTSSNDDQDKIMDQDSPRKRREASGLTLTITGLTKPKEAIQTRQTGKFPLIFALLMLGAAIWAAPFYFSMAQTTGLWQMTTLFYANSGFMVVAALSSWFVYRKRTTLSISLEQIVSHLMA